MINTESLLKLSGVKKFNKDTLLIREGDAESRALYILLHGTAGACKNYGTPGQLQLESYGPGGFFGEMSLFLEKAPELTIVALTDLIALEVTRQNCGELFSTQPEITFMIMEGLCKKMDILLSAVPGGAVSQSASKKSALFPQGHGSYLLPLQNENNDYLYAQNITCPVCGYAFDNMTVIASRLKLERTDSDLRVRYKDIEPLYYDIITCPSCLYSAQTESFPNASKRILSRISEEVAFFKSDTAIKTGVYRDTFTVFAGFYLAMICAPHCFDDYQLVTAGLWQKLSRLYQDCEDDAMYRFASDHALEDYLYAYEHFNIREKQMQQLCYILGDLYQRQDELDKARNFFYLAKTNKEGTAVMKQQADRKLEEIKELLNLKKGK